MKKILARLLIPLVIALCCVAGLVFVAWLRPSFLDMVELGARDYLFLREDGPQWGRRPVRDEIVLVMFDAKSSKATGGELPGYAEDLRLYQALVDAGARVVADTRMVAAAQDEAMRELEPLLEGMRKLRDDGTLVRDAWPSIDTQVQQYERWAPCLAPVVLTMHPGASRDFESRFLPLVTFQNVGPAETMPLRVLRAWSGQQRATSDELNQQLMRCGIVVSWLGEVEGVQYRTSSPPCYQVGDIDLQWFAFPSESTLVPGAAYWVSYDAAPDQYPVYSYTDVLGGAVRAPLAGKIILVGTAAGIDPTPGTFSVPTSLEKVSAAEVVAAALQTLLDQRFFHPLPTAPGLVLVLLFTVALATASALLRPWLAVAASGLILIGYYAMAVWAYQHGWIVSVLLVPLAGIIAGGCGGTYQLLLAIRARSRVVDLFGRYVPRAVVQQLMQKPELETLVVGGVRREVTVMFADIRGFTTFSERLAPEQVLVELNSLLDGMVACTFAAEGTLDKFIGDAILVLFNAPLEQPDHVQRAVATALQIQARVAGHASGLALGIGIHTGVAVVGNVGTPERMEYTAIGSTVNVASRLCDVARPGEIIVSAQVASQLGDDFQLVAREPVRVKGIAEPLEIQAVTGRK